MLRSPDPSSQALLTVRSAVIIGAACIIGALAAVLTYIGSGSTANALLAAGGSTGGAIGFLNRIIGASDDDASA